MAKTFYGVLQTYDDKGHVTARIIETEAEKRPENTYQYTWEADIYVDYFDTRKEALDWKREALNA